MKNVIINITDCFRNGIEEELEELESNGDISFSCVAMREQFISDLLQEMLERYEDNISYYGISVPNFADFVSDKIEWDKTYYGITVIGE